MGLAEPVGIIAHDAGAANHLLAYVNANPDGQYASFMAGPALKMWRDMFPDRPLSSSVEEAIAASASIVTGTGWASDIEKSAVAYAKAKGKFCVSLIDHWTNYRARFEQDGEVRLPDEIWVTDGWAESIARQTFPSARVIQKSNLYLQGQLESIARLPQGDGILYICEPARSDWGKGRAGEFQALEYFLGGIVKLGLPDHCAVRLRLHPSETPGTYDQIVSSRSNLTVDTAINLDEAIAASRWVAGMNSYALTIALAAGRTVFSTLPPWAPDCVLPQEGLIHIKDRLIT